MSFQAMAENDDFAKNLRSVKEAFVRGSSDQAAAGGQSNTQFQPETERRGANARCEGEARLYRLLKVWRSPECGPSPKPASMPRHDRLRCLLPCVEALTKHEAGDDRLFDRCDSAAGMARQNKFLRQSIQKMDGGRLTVREAGRVDDAGIRIEKRRPETHALVFLANTPGSAKDMVFLPENCLIHLLPPRPSDSNPA